MNTTDWLGFIGVFLILLAYVLNVTNKLTTTSVWFILLNLIGASIACLASVLIKYMPFVLLEGIWASISLYSLINHLRATK
ncbi:hypothetical protein SAMN05444411_102217 [Lutibacter oricola]|uniref:CBU-0592-like domain-containing protein n=1 Tax=Lutibacter oricola TaxID=762486 RepID=A0A1H2WJP8_9FLAO|nr:hypothetical protein [Lutibacter oricola]SDW80795.1 hypothetical protein SAMN05444411_102217 [Lutibacter oricola]